MSETKKIRIKLTARIRVEYAEVLEVPTDITEEQLDMLVNRRYDAVDGGKFHDDAGYWKRGTCKHEPAEPDATADGKVIIDDGRIDVIENEQLASYVL